MLKQINEIENSLRITQNLLNKLKILIEDMNKEFKTDKWQNDFYKVNQVSLSKDTIPIFIAELKVFREQFEKHYEQNLNESLLKIALIYRCPFDSVKMILNTTHKYDVDNNLKEKNIIEVIQDINNIANLIEIKPTNLTTIINELVKAGAKVQNCNNVKFYIKYAHDKTAEVSFTPNDYNSYTTAICDLDGILKKQLTYNKKNEKIKITANDKTIEGTFDELINIFNVLKEVLKTFDENI